MALAGPRPVETEQELLRPSELLVRLKKVWHIESSITLACGGSPANMSTNKDALPSMDRQLAQLEQRVHQLETCYKLTSLLNSE